jgi:metal-dependent hydrolase (beta-lactamase superfamily II)
MTPTAEIPIMITIQQAVDQTAMVETAAGAELMVGIFITREVPGGLPEQAPGVVTGRGLIIIIDCAHPGVDCLSRASIR